MVLKDRILLVHVISLSCSYTRMKCTKYETSAKLHILCNFISLGSIRLVNWFQIIEPVLSKDKCVVLCSWEKHIYPHLVLVQLRKTHPDITEKLLTGT